MTTKSKYITLDPEDKNVSSIIASIYSQKQSTEKRGPWTTMAGHRLTVHTAAYVRPEHNIGSLAIDVAEFASSTTPLIFDYTDKCEIYSDGVGWIVEEFLPGEELLITIPLPDLTLLKLPDSEFIIYGSVPANDPDVDRLMARGDSHIDLFLRHRAGEEIPFMMVELPDFPISTDKHAAWWKYCWEECKQAGLDDGDTCRRLLGMMRQVMSQNEVAVIASQLDASRWA